MESIDNGGTCCPVFMVPPANVTVASNVLSTSGNVIAGNILSVDGTFTGNLYVAGAITGNVTFTSLNLTSLNSTTVVSQAFFGNGAGISNLNSANIVGTVGTAQSVTNASQPNITSVGTLTGLTVSGLLVASNGSAISNLNSANIVGTVGTAQSVTTPSQPNITSVGTLTGLTVSGLLVASNGSAISNLNSANLVGTVGTAQSVTTPSQPNITSVGTLTGLNVQGLAIISNGSAISNLNSANLVGTVGTAQSVTNPSQPNITSVGTLTGLTVSGLFVANGSAISNLNSANIVGTVGTAQSVTNPSQPNITSVGTLTGLNVQGLFVASNGSAISNLNSSNLVGTIPIGLFPTSGATAGTYGSGANVAQVTVDTYGRVTSASNVAIVSSQWSGAIGSPIYYLNQVGIGTSTPSANLHVSGNLYVTNAITTNNLFFNNSILDTNLPVLTGFTGVYGSSSNIPQLTVDQYGRVSTVTNVAIVSSQWTSNAANVTYGNGVSIGTLSNPPSGSNLYVLGLATMSNIAGNGYGIYSLNSANLIGPISNSSLIPTGVTAGVYGNGAAISQFTVDQYGRINSASNVVISSVNTTALVGTISVGNLPASGVNAGTYGSSANISQVTVDQYGRVTTASNVALPTVYPVMNVTSANVTTANVTTLNTSTLATLGNLVVPNQANVYSANVTTLNIATTNTQILFSNSANILTLNSGSVSGTFYGNLLGSNLISALNIVASNSVSAQNIAFGSLYGNVISSLNIVSTNAVTTTNVLANTLTVISQASNIIYISNSSGLSNVLVMNQYGNVGIGTTDPWYKLDVEGHVNLGSQVNDNYNIYFSGGEQSIGQSGPLLMLATNNTQGYVVLYAGYPAYASFGGANSIFQVAGNVYTNGLGGNIWAANAITTTNAFFTNMNVASSNLVTTNVQFANIVTANVQNLNVSTGANITQLSVTSLANIASANILTATFQTVNAVSSNLVTANLQTSNTVFANVQNMNVSTGANVTQLSVTTLANIQSANVLTANIRTSNIVTENAQFVNISSNLSVFGQSFVSGTFGQSFNLVVAAGAGSFSNICSLRDTPYGSGIYVMHIDLMSRGASGSAGTKSYLITTRYNLSGGAWLRAIPLSKPGGPNQIGLDLLSSGGITYMRATRLDSVTETVNVGLVIRTSSTAFSTVVVTDLTSETGTGATNAGFWPTAIITENNGRAGISTEDPSANLQVTGNIYASNAVSTTNVITTSANISFGTVSTLANIASANIVTANIQTSNTVFSNILNLNVSTGANVTYLSAGQANLVSSNLVTANVQSLNTVFSNILNLNVSTGANVTYLTAGQANLVSSNLVTANVQSLNSVFSNLLNLNVSTGANVTYLSADQANIVSSNLVTANLQTSNTVFANVLNLNVSTGANVTYLSADQANLVSSNLVTANIQTLNSVFSNLLNLNVSTGANVTYLSADQANIVSSNLVTANVQTLNSVFSNLLNLNVSTGANVTYLTAGQANLVSSNLVTANLQTSNTVFANVLNLNVSAGANVTYLTAGQANLVSSNLVTTNVQSLNSVFSNLLNLNVSTGANVTYLSAGQANLVSSNLVTANVQTLNSVFSNVLNLNVSTGANVTYLSAGQANLVSSNLVTTNVQTLNTVFSNILNLNVSTGANVTYLTAGQANLVSSNLVTANLQTSNTVFANVLNLNVSTGANVTYLTAGQANLVSSNLVTANVQTLNSVFSNLLNLNVSTGANVTYLTAGQANLVSSNLVTANVQSLNSVFSNLLNLNVSTGANVTYLTAGQANIVSSNLVTANVQTLNSVFSNLLNLNVSTGANVTYLTADQANLVYSNLVTANLQTSNTVFANILNLNVSTGANVTYLSAGQANLVSSNLVTANVETLNTVFSNILNLNVSTGANVTYFTVSGLSNVSASNTVSIRAQTANVVFLNVISSANVTNLTVASNIVPVSATGNTYLTGNIIVSGNVYSQIGSPLGAGGGFYFSLPNFIVTQTPYTGSLYGTTYPLSVGLSNGFTINGTSTLITVTSNGNFLFNTAGPYLLRAVFYGSDNITGLAVGSNVADIHGQDQSYMYRYTTQITQNPTELIEIPFNVTDTSKYYYLDLFMNAPGRLYETANTSGGGTYLTITPLTGGGLATGGPGGTPGTQWISSGSNIYYPNSVGVGTSPSPIYNLDVGTGITATQRLVTSNISSLGPLLNVNSNVTITANLAVGGITAPALTTPPYALTVYGQGYFSNHVTYENFSGWRNRLINGTFRVAARANSITVSNTSSFSLSNSWVMDRWHIDQGNLSTSNVSITIRQDSPVGPPNGFSNVANVSVQQTFGANLDNTWLCPLVQTIEASGVFDLRLGQPTALPMVLSFYANVYPVGNYSVVVRSKLDNTYYANLVTVTNSWNRYIVYLPKCTTGSWGVGEAGALEVCLFGLSFGVTRANVATTTNWTASPGYAPIGVTGATNWMQTGGAYLQVTGVQIELGTIATPFEARLLAETTRFCQRYYETNPQTQYAAALTSGRTATIPYVTTKRNDANVSVYYDSSNLTANTNIGQMLTYTGAGTVAVTPVLGYISEKYGFSVNFTQGGNNFNTLINEANFVWQADAEIY